MHTHAHIRTYIHTYIRTYIGTQTVTQIKFKLDNRCSNNQAEQLAITRALEAIDTISTEESNPRTATVYTDSRLTIDSLRNPDNHAYLIEEIRRRIAKLQGSNWKIEFSWVKAHAGNYGNELADKLAKEVARSKHRNCISQNPNHHAILRNTTRIHTALAKGMGKFH